MSVCCTEIVHAGGDHQSCGGLNTDDFTADCYLHTFRSAQGIGEERKHAFFSGVKKIKLKKNT